MATTLGIAIFGLGRAGTIHLRGVCNNRRAELKYVVEERTQYARDTLASYMIGEEVQVIQYKDSDQIFNDQSVGAIIVCTPTATHEEIVRRGLKSGKAVFCEKPISASIENTMSCYTEAEKYNRPLFCAFNRRFDSTISHLRKRTQLGEIGQVQCVKTVSRDAQRSSDAYLKISGGIFHDSGIHDIDIVCWILDEEPESVFVQAHAFRESIAEMGDVDQVLITMKFPSGALASIDLSRHALYGYDQRIEAFGSKGMLQVENQRPTSLINHNEAGTTHDCLENSFTTRYKEAYERELAHFTNVTLGIEAELSVRKKDTFRASIVAEACEYSWRERKMVMLKEFKEKWMASQINGEQFQDM